MQKILALTLSFVVLLQSSSIDFSDFSKIDDLVAHVKVHLEQGESITEFIHMHYGDQFKTHKDEHKNHQKLPFKHKKIDSQIQLVFCLNHSVYEFQVKLLEIIANNFIYKEHALTLPDIDFFQPPKIA
jgi:hypothetical protein